MTHNPTNHDAAAVKDELSIVCRLEGSRAVVELAGELDMHTATALLAQLEDLQRQPLSVLEIDAGRLTFADSAGLRAILRARAESQSREVGFRVSAVSPQIERVIDLAGLRELLLPAA